MLLLGVINKNSLLLRKQETSACETYHCDWQVGWSCQCWRRVSAARRRATSSRRSPSHSSTSTSIAIAQPLDLLSTSRQPEQTHQQGLNQQTTTGFTSYLFGTSGPYEFAQRRRRVDDRHERGERLLFERQLTEFHDLTFASKTNILSWWLSKHT